MTTTIQPMQVFRTTLLHPSKGTIIIQTAHGCEAATWSTSAGDALVMSLHDARERMFDLLDAGWKVVAR